MGKSEFANWFSYWNEKNPLYPFWNTAASFIEWYAGDDAGIIIFIGL